MALPSRWHEMTSECPVHRATWPSTSRPAGASHPYGGSMLRMDERNVCSRRDLRGAQYVDGVTVNVLPDLRSQIAQPLGYAAIRPTGHGRRGRGRRDVATRPSGFQTDV